MAKFEKRIEAKKLRKRGLSIGIIAKTLQVSKSTASKWCIDLDLSIKQRQLISKNAFKAGMKGRLIGAAINRNRKLNNIQLYLGIARSQLGDISLRDRLAAGTALYWAEGAKSDTTFGFSFMNSDPQMVLFIKNFLNLVMSVSDKDIICVVQINSIHEKRINKVLKFWSILLELPLKQFNKPYYINVKPKKVYENYNDYYGTLRMKVRKSSNLKYHMLGLIEAFKKPV